MIINFHLLGLVKEIRFIFLKNSFLFAYLSFIRADYFFCIYVNHNVPYPGFSCILRPLSPFCARFSASEAPRLFPITTLGSTFFALSSSFAFESSNMPASLSSPCYILHSALPYFLSPLSRHQSASPNHLPSPSVSFPCVRALLGIFS